MKVEEITPNYLSSLTRDEWEHLQDQSSPAWPTEVLDMLIQESCTRMKADYDQAVLLDKIRCQRFPESGPRRYPDTFEEWWAQTGKEQYEAELAGMVVKPQPGNPN